MAGGTNWRVVSSTILTQVSSSPGRRRQYTSTGSFSASSLLICLLGWTDGVLADLMLMGVLSDAKGVLTEPAIGVLVAPRPLLAGVLARLGFILSFSHFLPINYDFVLKKIVDYKVRRCKQAQAKETP